MIMFNDMSEFQDLSSCKELFRNHIHDLRILVNQEPVFFLLDFINRIPRKIPFESLPLNENFFFRESVGNAFLDILVRAINKPYAKKRPDDNEQNQNSKPNRSRLPYIRFRAAVRRFFHDEKYQQNQGEEYELQ